jgi:penicillin-binding protein 2
MHSLSSETKQSWLSWFLRGLLILLFLILIAKLIEVQIIKGAYYRELSEENRIRHVAIPAPRGRILAKGGEVLAGNIEVKKSIKFTSETGFVISDDLTKATPEKMVTDYKRTYPLGDKFSHAIGYLAQIDPSQVGKINADCPAKGPRISDGLVGKTGLEQEYECILSGTPGEALIEVDATGAEIRVLGRREPVPGKDLLTTVDYGLQLETASDMEGKKGAAIVTDPTGKILAFYSYPTYDPNIFINKGNSNEISNLLTNEDLPFFNRVIAGTFHPGSVFKPLVALAALEEGAVDENYTYNDTGIITVNDYSYTNWYFTEYGRSEGVVNLVKAMARSTDTFFYTIGQMVGPDKIAKWASTFGLDAKTGIDIPGEVKGLIPTPEWKEKTKNESWYLGNTYHMSIGQGDVTVTLVAMNRYISAIADGGKLCVPHFIDATSQNFQFPISNFQCERLELKKQNLELVKTGMEAACSEGGTAYTFTDFAAKHGGVKVACKTGTAEVSVDGSPHAWFTFYAPADNPQIVTTILIEKGGQGSSVAGPIARKIADYYFASFAN